MNRFDSFYDISDGDWGWINTNIDEDHEEFRTLDVPETAEEWFFTAFRSNIKIEGGGNSYSLCNLPPSIVIINNWRLSPFFLQEILLKIFSFVTQ